MTEKSAVQSQQPGIEYPMDPKPQVEHDNYLSADKLSGKVALITGGDSGIGKAVAIAFAKEGADICIVYLNEDKDANITAARIKALGRQCLLMRGDIGQEAFCINAIQSALNHFGHLHILVNNAAEQHSTNDFSTISQAQLQATFSTNIFSMFYLCKALLPYLQAGDVIINSTSVTAYRGSKHLIDYAATKGAIVSFTRSLAMALVEQNVRVNAVAPGPIWTPLIPATFNAEEVAHFGEQVPMQRKGEPYEIAPSYVFLASADSSYMTGQILHPNGGEIVGG